MRSARDNQNLGSHQSYIKEESGAFKQPIPTLATWKSPHSKIPRDNIKRNPLDDIFSQNKANSYFSQNNLSGFHKKAFDELFPSKNSHPVINQNYSGYLKRTKDDETNKPYRNNSTSTGINNRGLNEVFLEKERRRSSPFERKLKTSQTYIEIAFTKQQKKQDPYFFETLKTSNNSQNNNPVTEFNNTAQFQKEQARRHMIRQDWTKGLDKELDIGLRVQSDMIDRKAIQPKPINWLKASDPQKYPIQRNIFQAVPNMEINRLSNRLEEYTCAEVQNLSTNYINELSSLQQTLKRLISQTSHRRIF